MAYGLKISKENQDVKTATEKNLILTSNRESLKVKLSGGGTYYYSPFEVIETINAPQLVKTYNHNLGYIPFVLAFVETTDTEGKNYSID